MNFLNEAMCSFRGPWDRFWYLSDGGHFENLGGYELLRRRVPYIIMLDGGADPDNRCSEFAALQRIVRIDFGAEIQPISVDEWTTLQQTAAADPGSKPGGTDWAAISAAIAVSATNCDGQMLGELFAPPAAGCSAAPPHKHAALFKVNYPNSQKISLLLLVKASLTGDEPSDVTEYNATHPAFPNEGTEDQFFTESQWESYRRLGEHIGDIVLGPEPNPATHPGAAALGRLNLWMAQMKAT
jgi:hypothetical protein